MSNSTKQLTIEELLETFELVEDWEERYRFIIDLGRSNPKLDEALKTEENRVHGCQSRVWMVPKVVASDPVRLDFIADSDSQIVKGLIGVLRVVYANKTPDEISAFDVEAFFQKIGLSEHLTPGRRNGLREMCKRIVSIAEAAA